MTRVVYMMEYSFLSSVLVTNLENVLKVFIISAKM